MNALPPARKWIWAVVALLVVMTQGPSFLQSFRTTWREGNDFFQDWASARNVLHGRPAYLPLSKAISLYYPRADVQDPPAAHLPWNAHPPTSVLATLPLALFDYPQAGTLWNLMSLIALVASLGLIARELNLYVRGWSILPIVTMGLLCSPIRAQITQGQWNAPILLVVTLAWVAGRRGRDVWAGCWVGTAITLKLFPILLLAYFVIQRRWHALAAGCLAAILLSFLTTAVLGVDAYRDYYILVLPTLPEFRSWWPNASILAFWTKNLGVGASYYGVFAAPVMKVPQLAQGGILLSCAAVTATTIFIVSGTKAIATDRAAYGDICYSLMIVTMLLLSPICWDHYLLLLALPLALLWIRLGQSSFQRLSFLVLVAAIWGSPNEFWRAGGVDLLAKWPDFLEVPPGTYQIHRRFFVPVFLSLHCYALAMSYVWLVLLARKEVAAAGSV
jgi:hypothetical protein